MDNAFVLRLDASAEKALECIEDYFSRFEIFTSAERVEIHDDGSDFSA
jgi:hypothetical protein